MSTSVHLRKWAHQFRFPKPIKRENEWPQLLPQAWHRIILYRIILIIMPIYNLASIELDGTIPTHYHFKLVSIKVTLM